MYASPLAKVVPPASERLLDLLSSMLQWDPKRRPSAAWPCGTHFSAAAR